VKWPVNELLSRRQERPLKMWLRYAEILRDEEELVHIYETETRKSLRSCQVGSNESSDCQVGNEMGSLEDIKYFQVRSVEIPYCQVGKEGKMRSCKSLMNSEVSSNQ